MAAVQSAIRQLLEHSHPHTHGDKEAIKNGYQRRILTHTHVHEHPDPEATALLIGTRSGGWHNAAQSHDATHWHFEADE